MKMLDDILMAHTGVESGKRGGSPRELDLNRVPPAAMGRNDACRGPVTPHLRHVQRIDALGRDLGRRVLDRTHGRHIRCLGPLARLGGAYPGPNAYTGRTGTDGHEKPAM